MRLASGASSSRMESPGGLSILNRRGRLAGMGHGDGKLHILARAMLWTAGAKAVDFDEHDQAGAARRHRRIFSAARGVGRDRSGLLIGLRDRLARHPKRMRSGAFHHIDHPGVAVRVDQRVKYQQVKQSSYSVRQANHSM